MQVLEIKEVKIMPSKVLNQALNLDSKSSSSSDSENDTTFDPRSKGSPSFGACFVQVGLR